MIHVSKRMTLAAITALSPFFFLNSAQAESNNWKIDTAHSSAGFSVRHMMVSNVRGRFPKVKGSAVYDGKKIKSIEVNAIINAASIDTDDEKRDKHLKGKDFFNVEKFPKITFKSKKVKKGKKGTFKLFGDLTMHGVTKPVVLEVEGPSKIIKGPFGKTRTGAYATTTINRKDFGITYGGVMDNGGAVVSDDVKITLDVELVKAGDKKAKKSKKKSS